MSVKKWAKITFILLFSTSCFVIVHIILHFHRVAERLSPSRKELSVTTKTVAPSRNESGIVTKKVASSRNESAVGNCMRRVPYQYPDELDFRIIVLTYNRPASLRKCLSHIAKLDTLGDKIGVDIWIDRSKEDKVDEKTINVSRQFEETWTGGQVHIHIQERNAYIIGQWVDTWRPRENSREIALILEDDIDISPLTYKWLKLMDSRFRNVSDIAGYTLQMENVNYVKGGIRPVGNTRKTDNVFIYRLMGTWGFSPKPNEWRNFQDWFHEVCKNKTFRPYIPGTVMNSWFKMFEKQGREESMWEMWAVYYYNKNNLYTVYSNLLKYTGSKNTLLDTNRKEAGLHFGKAQHVNKSNLLLSKWESAFETFPSLLPRYDYDGKVANMRNALLL